MENKYFKYCLVPLCKSTTKRTPTKIFFRLPHEPNRRLKWLKACRRETKDISPKSQGLHVCEDHFDLKEDMDNYMKFKLMGGLKKIKNSVVPHIFDCQPDRKRAFAHPGNAISTTNSVHLEDQNSEHSGHTQDEIDDEYFVKIENNYSESDLNIPTQDETDDKSVVKMESCYSENDLNIPTEDEIDNKSFVKIENDHFESDINVEFDCDRTLYGQVKMENQSDCEQEVKIKEAIKEECEDAEVKIETLDTDTGFTCNGAIQQLREEFELKVEDDGAPENVSKAKLLQDNHMSSDLRSDNFGEPKACTGHDVVTMSESEVTKHSASLSAYRKRRSRCKQVDKKRKGRASGSSHSYVCTEEEDHPDLALETSKLYECINCTYKTAFPPELTTHLLEDCVASSYCPGRCMYCNVAFKSIKRIDEHIKTNHPDFVAYASGKIYECKNCMYKTASKINFQKHVLNCNRSRFSTLEKQPNVIKNVSSKIYECTNCSYKASYKRRFCNHLFKKHPNAATNILYMLYQCANCPYKTAVKCDLVKHMQKHFKVTRNYKNKCLHCNDSFHTKKKRDGHILMVHCNFAESKIQDERRTKSAHSTSVKSHSKAVRTCEYRVVQ
ncbi:unnamed protein product [Callosobruchus maculatus]|uniref:THAP-type domain-containing protein n=1 Tax=Callosobruchus maculatus TaxID=64391 RepID=A0A653CNF3_CALMS|nr:unnamed protein product [Callosobruchus maculatus]